MTSGTQILIANDDGITADGIILLAEIAKKYGNVTVVAPDHQCSGMSQRLSLFEPINLKKVDFPVDGVNAWSISGTPADCVKIACEYILPCKPDYVFSGINSSLNVGFDVMYSGTIGAAMEGLMRGAKAYALSVASFTTLETAKRFLTDILKQTMETELKEGEIWNINFPFCTPDEVKGVLWNLPPAHTQAYQSSYDVAHQVDGSTVLVSHAFPKGSDAAPNGTDVHAVTNGYISVSRIRCQAF